MHRLCHSGGKYAAYFTSHYGNLFFRALASNDEWNKQTYFSPYDITCLSPHRGFFAVFVNFSIMWYCCRDHETRVGTLRSFPIFSGKPSRHPWLSSGIMSNAIPVQTQFKILVVLAWIRSKFSSLTCLLWYFAFDRHEIDRSTFLKPSWNEGRVPTVRGGPAWTLMVALTYILLTYS